VEAGRPYTFQLVVQNPEPSSEDIVLETTGEADNWVTFGSEEESDYVIFLSPFSTVFIPIIITADDDTDTGVYSAKIKADDETIVTLSIRVVPPLSDIEILEEQAVFDFQFDEIKAEITTLSDSVMSEITAANQNFANRLNTISDLQSSINEVSSKQDQLARDVSEVGGGITGGVAASASTVGFIVGLIVAAIALYLLSGKRVSLRMRKKKKSEGYEFTRSQ
jgi:hypothetical protein